MLLTVEYHPAGEVEIYCDKEGLERLLRELAIVQKNGGHTHLMTPSWAGNELTEEQQGERTQLINHVLIVLKPATWTDATGKDGQQ